MKTADTIPMTPTDKLTQIERGIADYSAGLQKHAMLLAQLRMMLFTANEFFERKKLRL
jgi:hypothetical protein